MKRLEILFVRMASYFELEHAHPENVMMPVDLAIMATIAEQAGHGVSLIDTEANTLSFDDLADQIRAAGADLVVLKAKSPSAEVLRRLLRAVDTPVIGIGQAFIGAAEDFLHDELPFLCIIKSEPEETFRALLAKIERSESIAEVEGIATRVDGELLETPARALVEDLDTLPAPKYSWFLNQDYYSFYPVPRFVKKRMAFMLSARGCPLRCIFCSPTLRQSAGRAMRFHSVDRIVSEMRMLRGQGITIVQFRDDIFTADRERAKRLCQQLIAQQIGMKWIIQTHVNFVDEELLCLMKEAGLISVGFGLESGSERVLKRLRKANDLPHARVMFQRCRQLGIRTVGFFLVGNPGETLSDLDKTQQLVRDLQPDLIQVAYFTPYPGSNAYDELLASGTDVGAPVHHYNSLIHNFSAVSTATLTKVHRQIYLDFITRPSTLLRLTLDTAAGLVVNPRLTSRLLRSAVSYLALRPLAQAFGRRTSPTTQ